MVKILVRAETPSDYPAIRKVTNLAFGQGNEGNLVEKLRKKKDYDPALSLVAEIGGKIVGHILFFPVKIGAHTSVCLAPVSVLPEHQKKGVGTALTTAGLKKAKEKGYSSVIVVGHPGYYPRFGFKKASTWGISCPFEVPDEAFMALELSPGALNDVRGVVDFPTEYAEAV